MAGRFSRRSAADALLPKAFEWIWERGERYADGGRVKIVSSDEQGVRASVKGTKRYSVELRFAGGGLRRTCTCPYVGGGPASHPPCKHQVAVAIVWDEQRGMRRPNLKAVSSQTIPPPLVSQAEITRAFRYPLRANLDVLRLAAESSGSWSRPHAKLPNCPKFSDDQKKPLATAELKNAIKEIERWADRRGYDPYFCAGEMVAAYCEVLRQVAGCFAVTPPYLAAEVLLAAQQFHYQLIKMIDDSDGLHEFTEAHLEAIYGQLRSVAISRGAAPELKRLLSEYEQHREDY